LGADTPEGRYQRDWTASGDPATIVDALRRLAKTAGMTDDTLDACLNDADKAQDLVGWYRANAERDDVRSTPTFLINGEKYSNMSYAEFQTVLDEKIAATKGGRCRH